MAFIFLLCMVSDNPAPLWVLKDHGIYERISPQSAALDEDGNLFLVNSEEAKVLKITPSGEIERSFGGKGKGPGEMTRPKILHVEGKIVFVSDFFSRKILQFDTNGHYLTAIDHGIFTPTVAKTKNHWLYFSPIFDNQKSRSYEFVQTQADFKEPKQLMVMEGGKGYFKDEPIFEAKTDQATRRTTMGFNPTPTWLQVLACCKGTRAVAAMPGIELKLLIYDGVSGEILREINRELKPALFNQEWGLEKLKEAQERDGNFVDYRENFPKYYPAVRTFHILDDGTILIATWGAHPETYDEVLAFSAEGEEIKAPFKRKALEALLVDRGDKVWIQYESEEGEPEVACLRRADLASFVKNSIPKIQD